MHVAFVVAHFPPSVGGVQTHVHRVALGLRDRGVRVTVLVAEDGDREVDGLDVIGFGQGLGVNEIYQNPAPRTSARLRAMLRSSGATCVSTHTRFFPATWMGIRQAHRLGLPVLHTEHGGGFIRTANPAVNAAARAVDLSSGRWALQNADAVVAVSEQAKSFVYRLARRPSTVVGNGIDMSAWACSPPIVDKDRWVFVGRLVREKGWETFLRSVAAGRPVDGAVLIGDGPDRSRVEQSVANLGLAGEVQVTGGLPPALVREYLHGSLYVNPSVAAEGLQTTLLEAASAGSRIATYDVGGAAEVASAGAVVATAPRGDEVALGVCIQRMRHASWSPAVGLSAFDWSHVTQRYFEALSHLSIG